MANSELRILKFSALYEISKAKELGIPFYYLGFWVKGCANMEYKASFGPNELLEADGSWQMGTSRGC